MSKNDMEIGDELIEEGSMEQRLDIEIATEEYRCSDGCCYESTYMVTINDGRIIRCVDDPLVLVATILEEMGYRGSINGVVF
jgi:hypothetical protein